MKKESIYMKIFEKYDLIKTVKIGCIFGGLGLLWFHFSGFWSNPKNADIYEWMVFFILCILSIIFWFLLAKNKK